MIGRRVTGDDPITACQHAGDYFGPVLGFTGDAPAVFFLLPIARDEGVPAGARSLHHVVSPPHTFTEEPDGTLTVRASIAAGRPEYWHGFLERGIWRVA